MIKKYIIICLISIIHSNNEIIIYKLLIFAKYIHIYIMLMYVLNNI